MDPITSPNYWQHCYQTNQANWDLGEISAPLKAYFDTLAVTPVDKSIRILIAGAGNAYEASYLHKLGFFNVYVLDIVPLVLENFAKCNPTFDPSHLICDDFFNIHTLKLGQFDLIIEQTFLCTLEPMRRPEYAHQMHRLLATQGRLVGVLFDCDFTHSPPFGGHLAEYRTLFEPYFDIQIMERCYNSIKPRAGRELFIQLIKKAHSC